MMPPKASTPAVAGRETFAAHERAFMLGLARKTVASVVSCGDLPDVGARDVVPKLLAKRACFVTLTRAGALRGCIGHVLPQAPLYKAIMDNTRGAALRDPRFAPVQPDEVHCLKIEISVLTEPQPLHFVSLDDLLDKLQPYQDGVLLRIGERMSTFLPQVWAQIPDKAAFLDHLAQKAGYPPAAWRGKDASISIYQAETFQED